MRLQKRLRVKGHEMNCLRFCLVWIVGLLVVSCGNKEVVALNSDPIRLAIDLVDGSRVIGVVDDDFFSLTTPYATLKIDPTKIRKMAVAKNRNGISFQLGNGDQITGQISARKIPLTTIFGHVELSLRDVQQIQLYPDEVDHPELVLYYPFDAKQEVIDQSGRGNDGLINGARWIKDGRVGGAFHFDGVDDYIDCGVSSSLQLSLGFTYSLWFRSDHNHEGQLLGRRSAGDTAFDIASHLTFRKTGGITAGICGTDYAPGKSARYEPEEKGLQELGDGRWHHAALVYVPGESLTLYIDGELHDQNIEAIFTSLNESKLPVLIGAAVSKHFFCGDIDEVMIFDGPLTLAQVRGICRGPRFISLP